MSTPLARATTFAFSGWQADPDKPALHFNFTCAHFGPFRETVHLPALKASFADCLDEPLARLITLLHLALGVSYYKCAAARQIILPPGLCPAGQAMAHSLYTEGLAEFFVRAELPFPADLDFTQNPQAAPTYRDTKKPAFPATAEALVAFGGGKDSAVAAAIINKTGLSTRLCAVVLSDKVAKVLQATAPESVLFLHRKLDPKLREVNASGAFNGHVPITAINSLMLIVLGRLSNATHVVFANERSADEPTMQIGPVSANHQFSKSSSFENLLRQAVRASDPVAPNYFSVLRPYSEIWIGRAFAKLKTPFTHFTSCNKNFQISGKMTPRWCGACAKCAFTSLILSPFLSPTEAASIFPDNFLNRRAFLPIWRELCGLATNKPWDCVGTINECRASLYQLSLLPHGRETLIVKTLLPEIFALTSKEKLQASWVEALTPVARHFVPDPILQVAHEF